MLFSIATQMRYPTFAAICLAALGMSMLCPSPAYAAPQETRAEQSAAEPPGAAEIVDALRDNPEALREVKAQAARYLQSKGQDVQPADISDGALFSRIENDPELRGFLTEAAKSRGLLKGDGEKQGPPAAVKSPRPARPAAEAEKEEKPHNPDAVGGMSHRNSPYEHLQALRDLYTQITPQGAPLARFGIDVFRRGAGNIESLPSDLPAGSDYVLGSGDGVEISLWGGVSQHFSRTIDREGRVALPEAGPLLLSGLTLGDARARIAAALAPQFRNTRVDVSLSRLRTVRVYVVGDVEHPGAYDISSLSTPLNALAAAGGASERGSLRFIRHYRGKRLLADVDLYDLLLKGVQSDVTRMEPGDTLLIPPVGPQVTVAGMVRRPAMYEIRNEKSLAETLELAGGALTSATLGQIVIDRIEAHERRTTISLKLPGGDGKNSRAAATPVAGGPRGSGPNSVDAPPTVPGDAVPGASPVREALAEFAVQDGDYVTIAPILPYSERTVYLEGHVFRPGRYAFRDGMQLQDLLHSYQDMLPEPAAHAELIRLEAPDFRPVTLDFNLIETLKGGRNIPLQPFDTVRVFGRYEIDSPKVVIAGEVLRPGEYPLSNTMTASELVRMAGGFKRSAMPETADVATYAVENGKKVLVAHKNVEIAKALAGDRSSDLVLQPGDILTVHSLTGYGDIGASVKITGEVAFPGVYGIQSGERLSSVLKRAGGFRPTAYAAAAVLERSEVRTFAEKSRADLIRRIETASASVKVNPAGGGQEQLLAMQAMQEQQQHIVSRLRGDPVSGRLVIQITSEIAQWENTAEDVEVRPGDTVVVPRRPEFVLVSGQVYNPLAISYTPGRTVASYLRAVGGTTDIANKGATFVVRANGSVLPMKGKGMFSKNPFNTPLQPGDTVVVPEKIFGMGSTFWKRLLETAQIASGMAIAGRVVAGF